MSNITQKATIATIQLGHTSIECFRFEDGTYGYEYSWLATLIDKDKQILSDKKSPYYLKAIMGDALTNQNIKFEGISAANNKKKYLTQNQLMLVLGAFARLGQGSVIDLLTACAIESLERRADAAHGRERDEQERNDKLEARQQHRVCFRELYTDWAKKDGCVSGGDYIKRVKQIKGFANTPPASIETYDSIDVKKLNNAEIVYDGFRRAGYSHAVALESI